MNTSLRSAAAKGFTLIELLIVVIIIAILAAIAIPQFANTTGDAQEGALDANLNTMRSALELYRVQHRGVYPSAAPSTTAANAACTAVNGTSGTGAAGSTAAFTEQLTMFSNAAGATCTVAAPAGGFSLGPYLRAIPEETLSNPPTSAVAITSTPAYVPPTTVTPGWAFNNNATVGRFVVNSSAIGRRGVALSTY
ncbi:MAG TPA: prepilin-type N-terminal cleavage/methylation domain-containing protein [Telluria sp.]